MIATKILFVFKKMFLRIKNISTEFLKLSSSYSLLYGFYCLLWWIAFYSRSSKLLSFVTFKKQQWLDRYIEETYNDIVEKYRCASESKELVSNFSVWVFWGQGENSMPSLVNACYKQMKLLNKPCYKVNFIDLQNVDKYVKLPDVVYRKLESGKLLYAHFSDILRNSLLAKYGGMWLDATCWTAHPIPQMALESVFFSPHNDDDNTKWCTYAMGSNHIDSVTFSFVRDMLIAVCERESVWPDYLFQDRLLSFAHRKLSASKMAIDATPTNSTRRFLLFPMLNKPFDIGFYQDLISTDWLFKLSYKSYFQTVDNGLETFYSKIINGTINNSVEL